MVLALDPALVVLDEPTAGLDPATRRHLVDRIAASVAARGASLVVISHDLADIARLADRVMVLYAGEAVEVGPTRTVVGEPLHPYTWALVNAHPVLATTKDLRPIRGLPPDPADLPSGCAYHPRCTQAAPVCREARPALTVSGGREIACHLGGLRTLLSAEDLTKTFARGRARIRALDGVSLHLREGESLGVIGPSGSGKSTLARILAGHLAPDSGRVLLEGAPIVPSWRRAERAARRLIQLIIQDPWDALSPHLTVEDLVAEPLDLGAEADRGARASLVRQALQDVGLPVADGFLRAYTHELSGGQLQRIVLARALLARPKVLVADEPTSMLDASEQARFVLLLRARQVEMGLGLVLISHDLALVRKVTDRIVVLDEGRVVEEGPSHLVTASARSLTARRLLAAAPASSLVDDGQSPGRGTGPVAGLPREAADEGRSRTWDTT
jgi:peptide/nickel transport system ATP-binding protein